MTFFGHIKMGREQGVHSRHAGEIMSPGRFEIGSVLPQRKWRRWPAIIQMDDSTDLDLSEWLDELLVRILS